MYRIIGIIVSLFLLVLFVVPAPLYAQVSQPAPIVSPTPQNQPDPLLFLSLLTPNVDSNVSYNQSTLFQSLFIEGMAASVCILGGVNPINPQQPCLGVNPQTHKLGYASADSKSQHLGGLTGGMIGMTTSLYTPVTSTKGYFEYLGSNFGIIKHTYAAGAAQTAGAFSSLGPLLPLWVAVRNISYSLLVLAFIFIGMGIMFRIQVDPRTVMTIQNQIPRVIIAIIFITFSYAIAAFMADLMWVSTYLGINALTAQTNPSVCKFPFGNNQPLSTRATLDLLNSTPAFVNDIMASNCPEGGIATISRDMGGAVVDLAATALSIPLPTLGGSTTSNQKYPGDCQDINILFNWQVCMLPFIVDLLVKTIMALIFFVIIIVALFRVWLELLKAFVIFLLDVVTGPMWIVFGLLPGKPLGLEKWLRSMLANLLVFPLTAFLFVGARILVEIFKNSSGTMFSPPLLGVSLGSNLAPLVSLGVFLIAPSLIKQLRDALKVQTNKYAAGALAGGFAAGAGIAGTPGRLITGELMRRNPQTGNAMGIGAHYVDVVKRRIGLGRLLTQAGRQRLEGNSQGQDGSQQT